LVFDFPALIPEVWLNYVGYDKTVEDEVHLRENPQRVDFVLFAEGSKAVIEVDGPSHYADFDEGSRTWTINERLYAKNLAIERSLRRQRWEIYRFANLEVDEAVTNDEFVLLVQDVRGFVVDSWFGRPEADSKDCRPRWGTSRDSSREARARLSRVPRGRHDRHT
jgi:hypothetical protein